MDMLCRMGETVTSLPHGGAAHLGWGPGLRGGCGYVCVLGGGGGAGHSRETRPRGFHSQPAGSLDHQLDVKASAG